MSEFPYTVTLVNEHGAESNPIPVRAATAKNGNPYWAVLARKNDGTRYFSSYGVKISASDLSLEGIPTKVRVRDSKDFVVTLSLDSGYTQGDKPRKNARCHQLRNVNGQDRMIKAVVSETEVSGILNLVFSIHGKGNKGSRVVSLSDL